MKFQGTPQLPQGQTMGFSLAVPKVNLLACLKTLNTPGSLPGLSASRTQIMGSIWASHSQNAPPISAPLVGMLTFTMPQSEPLGLCVRGGTVRRTHRKRNQTRTKHRHRALAVHTVTHHHHHHHVRLTHTFNRLSYPSQRKILPKSLVKILLESPCFTSLFHSKTSSSF